LKVGKSVRVSLASSLCTDTLVTADFIPESKSHVFNAGSPVWGIDWCPIHTDDRARQSILLLYPSHSCLANAELTDHSYAQYLAIAPFPTRSHSPEIGVKVYRPSKACIQIWSLRSTRAADAMDEDKDDCGEMKCEMVLCLEGGPAYDVKWCPLPSHDSVRPLFHCPISYVF
jgi:transcription factor C subunit 6